jgi:hypothetical protein
MTQQYNFTRPTKQNVELGDLLVTEFPGEDGTRVMPIVDLGDNELSARGSAGFVRRAYEQAVVLKKDGSYLVGKKAQD